VNGEWSIFSNRATVNTQAVISSVCHSLFIIFFGNCSVGVSGELPL